MPPCSPAGTAGSAIVKFTSELATCAVSTGAFAIPAYDTCASWKIATPTLKLALEVAGDCSITIKPMADTSCADPGAVNGQTKLVPLSGTYGYTYNDLTIRAYYTSATTIRTLLPSTNGGARCALGLWILVSSSLLPCPPAHQPSLMSACCPPARLCSLSCRCGPPLRAAPLCSTSTKLTETR